MISDFESEVVMSFDVNYFQRDHQKDILKKIFYYIFLFFIMGSILIKYLYFIRRNIFTATQKNKQKKIKDSIIKIIAIIISDKFQI